MPEHDNHLTEDVAIQRYMLQRPKEAFETMYTDLNKILLALEAPNQQVPNQQHQENMIEILRIMKKALEMMKDTSFSNGDRSARQNLMALIIQKAGVFTNQNLQASMLQEYQGVRRALSLMDESRQTKTLSTIDGIKSTMLLRIGALAIMAAAFYRPSGIPEQEQRPIASASSEESLRIYEIAEMDSVALQKLEDELKDNEEALKDLAVQLGENPAQFADQFKKGKIDSEFLKKYIKLRQRVENDLNDKNFTFNKYFPDLEETLEGATPEETEKGKKIIEDDLKILKKRTKDLSDRWFLMAVSEFAHSPEYADDVRWSKSTSTQLLVNDHVGNSEAKMRTVVRYIEALRPDLLKEVQVLLSHDEVALFWKGQILKDGQLTTQQPHKLDRRDRQTLKEAFIDPIFNKRKGDFPVSLFAGEHNRSTDNKLARYSKAPLMAEHNYETAEDENQNSDNFFPGDDATYNRGEYFNSQLMAGKKDYNEDLFKDLFFVQIKDTDETTLRQMKENGWLDVLRKQRYVESIDIQPTDVARTTLYQEDDTSTESRKGLDEDEIKEIYDILGTFDPKRLQIQFDGQGINGYISDMLSKFRNLERVIITSRRYSISKSDAAALIKTLLTNSIKHFAILDQTGENIPGILQQFNTGKLERLIMDYPSPINSQQNKDTFYFLFQKNPKLQIKLNIYIDFNAEEVDLLVKDKTIMQLINTGKLLINFTYQLPTTKVIESISEWQRIEKEVSKFNTKEGVMSSTHSRRSSLLKANRMSQLNSAELHALDAFLSDSGISVTIYASTAEKKQIEDILKSESLSAERWKIEISD